jgi:molybdopterin-guanine dinucleotide biosynthesis protein A
MILGAVLAGGQSSRFGSDKALAELDGRTLLARAVEALGAQCDATVIVGRTTGPAPCVADWPVAGMGPLGGIAGALNHALANGFATVLTCGVDSVGLPADLLARLSPAPCYVEAQPVVGHWPARAAGSLEELLFRTGTHSMRAFAGRIGARAVQLPVLPANINTPADLESAERRSHGL